MSAQTQSILAGSIEAARLAWAESSENAHAVQSEKSERSEKLEAAYDRTPNMSFHRVRNSGWIVTVNIDGYSRPADDVSFSHFTAKNCAYEVEVINDYTLFVRTDEQSEEVIYDEISLACLPF